MTSTGQEIIGFHLPTEPHGCFSNWYPARFTYAGISYNCVEQYMMAAKVMLGKRSDLYVSIMNARDPDSIKNLAGKDSYPEYMEIAGTWEKIRKQIVKRGVKAKFLQNPDLQKELLETGTALLAECAAHDKIWGVGINLHDPSWKDVSNWRGDNLLGRILMEVRDEIRQEIFEKSCTQYIDYRSALPVAEWDCQIGYMKRIPQYYNAINTYTEQLPAEHKKIFYNNTFAQVEYMMCVNMGGGFPATGFYEMKQEVYEIAHRLRHKSFVSEAFRVKPDSGWGSRGNPFLWDDLAALFAFDDISIADEQIVQKISSFFERKTGQPLTEDASVYVEEYAHGGMSSGIVTGSWVLNTCIPIILHRLKCIRAEEA